PLSDSPLSVLFHDIDGDGVLEMLVMTQGRQCVVCRLDADEASQPAAGTAHHHKGSSASWMSPWRVVEVLDVPSAVSFAASVKLPNGTRRLFATGPVHTIM